MKNSDKNKKNTTDETKNSSEVAKETANTPAPANDENAIGPAIMPDPSSSADPASESSDELVKASPASESSNNLAEVKSESAPETTLSDKLAKAGASENANVTDNEESKNSEETPAEKPWVETNPEYRPEPADLGLDEDGTPNISAHKQLNRIGKKIIALFAASAASNLPKLTGTQLTTMCRYEAIETAYQYSDPKSLRGRVILKADGQHLSLPLDINEEFDFGIDFEAMAERARQEGKEWGEAELAKAKEEAELDEKDKNRLSLEKLRRISVDIVNIFEERSKSNLPGVTEGEVLKACRNHVKSIGIDFDYANEERTSGCIILKEFKNEVRVPEGDGLFTFGIDYEAAAKAITEANNK